MHNIQRTMTNTILINKITYGEVNTPDNHLTSFVESRQITKIHPEIISNYQTLISVINHPYSLFRHSRSISLISPRIYLVITILNIRKATQRITEKKNVCLHWTVQIMILGNQFKRIKLTSLNTYGFRRLKSSNSSLNNINYYINTEILFD